MTPAQNKLITEAEKKAHFDKIRKKLEPEPKPTYNEGQKKWAKGMVEIPSQISMNLPNDYERELKRQKKLGNVVPPKIPSAKSGKQIHKLVEQKNQPLPPLIVTSNSDKAFRAKMDKDYELLKPRFVNAAKRLGVAVQVAK